MLALFLSLSHPLFPLISLTLLISLSPLVLPSVPPHAISHPWLPNLVSNVGLMTRVSFQPTALPQSSYLIQSDYSFAELTNTSTCTFALTTQTDKLVELESLLRCA